MLSAERHEPILRLLRRGRFATVADISQAARSSAATIRRDLARLERAGLIQRIRGGAEIVVKPGEGGPGKDELPGATNNDALLIRTERAMIDRARDLVVLADSTRFDRRGSLFLCGFDRIHSIITDDGISEGHKEMVASRAIRLRIAS